MLSLALIAALGGELLVGPDSSASAAEGGGASVTISGGGYGHGVGMSQYGARGRADAGQSAVDILAAYYPGTTYSTASQGPRVLLGKPGSLRLRGPAGVSLLAGGVVVAAAPPNTDVEVSASAGTVTATVLTPVPAAPVTLSAGGAALGVALSPGAPVTVSTTGRTYQRGHLSLTPGTSTIELVVDQLSMQEFLYGIAEVPGSWPTEALRAQVVAARSFAAAKVAAAKPSSTTDLSASSDMAYVGAAPESGSGGARWVQAVDDTAGLILTSGGAAIQAFFSSSNGGATERSGYVFATDLPYLVAGADPYDKAAGNTNHSWTRTYTSDELRSWTVASGRPDPGPIVAVDIGGNIGASGRVDRADVSLRGTVATLTMSGNQFRSLVNAGAPSGRTLLSTKFSTGSTPPPPSNRLPVGGLDFALPFFGVTLAVGWASDPDTPGKPVPVLLTVDGAWAALVWSNRTRAADGTPTAWAALVGLPRDVTVCAAAIDTSLKGWVQLGCRRVVKPPPPKRVKKTRRAARR